MATIKIHAVIGPIHDDGTVSCDYRGMADDALNEDHHTIGELEFGPDVTTNAQIEAAIADGPAWNRQTNADLKGMVFSGLIGSLAGLILGENVHLRKGVWDH